MFWPHTSLKPQPGWRNLVVVSSPLVIKYRAGHGLPKMKTALPSLPCQQVWAANIRNVRWQLPRIIQERSSQELLGFFFINLPSRPLPGIWMPSSCTTESRPCIIEKRNRESLGLWVSLVLWDVYWDLCVRRKETEFFQATVVLGILTKLHLILGKAGYV